jgi:hypothetical protein
MSKEVLKKFSVNELQKELERREAEKRVPQAPKLLADCKRDYSGLLQRLADGIQSVADRGFPPKDFAHDVFEKTMETFYGPDIWKWWNKRQ